MTAKFVYPTKEQWEALAPVLAELLDGPCVLVHPDVASRLKELTGREPDAGETAYDFGGSPDIRADVVGIGNLASLDGIADRAALQSALDSEDPTLGLQLEGAVMAHGMKPCWSQAE